MRELDKVARKNQSDWNQALRDGDPNTIPHLDLNQEAYRRYASGDSTTWPCTCGMETPEGMLMSRAVGKDVLCLASGGGQQSAELGLLGARVTVLDLTRGQLEADEVAARHYGYEVTTIQGDMRDLSVFDDSTFGHVIQGISLTFVPDVREVYGEVWRVLRSGGLYAVAHCNPATYPISFDGPDNGWDGVGYRISIPYCGGPIRKTNDGREGMTEGDKTGEHRHLYRDIFNGLIKTGFTIEKVWDQTWDEMFAELPRPETPEHERAFRAYFSILAKVVK